MDALQHSFALQADRPLLGAFALAACLAGGTATQNHAGVPRAVDATRFASGWEAGAPRQPDRTINALAASLVRPTSASFTASKPQASVSATRLTPAVAVKHPKHGAVTAVASPAVEPAAALVLAAAVPATPSGSVPIAVPEAAIPQVDGAAPAPLVAAATAAPVAPGTAARTIEPAPAEPEPLRLVSSPELRRFDLAKYAPAAPRAAKPAPSRKASASASASASGKSRLVDGIVYHHAAVEVAGQPSGDIPVRIGPDLKPSVKVADLLGLVSALMDPDTLARFQLASSANEYVSFAALRSAGFEVKYNAAVDSVAISVAP